MWIEERERRVNRKSSVVTISAHALDRAAYWNLDLEKIEETMRFGTLWKDKCEFPNKICYQRYYGKENITYVTIVKYYQDFIEVQTIWPQQGR